jgi:hypothetical protein
MCFPGVGHFMSVTGVPTTDAMWASTPFGTLALGGTAGANAHAFRTGDTKLKEFLDRVTK